MIREIMYNLFIDNFFSINLVDKKVYINYPNIAFTYIIHKMYLSMYRNEKKKRQGTKKPRHRNYNKIRLNL